MSQAEYEERLGETVARLVAEVTTMVPDSARRLQFEIVTSREGRAKVKLLKRHSSVEDLVLSDQVHDAASNYAALVNQQFPSWNRSLFVLRRRGDEWIARAYPEDSNRKSDMPGRVAAVLVAAIVIISVLLFLMMNRPRVIKLEHLESLVKNGSETVESNSKSIIYTNLREVVINDDHIEGAVDVQLIFHDDRGPQPLATHDFRTELPTGEDVARIKRLLREHAIGFSEEK